MAWLLILVLVFAVSQATADEEPYIGVNIGTDLSIMPHPTQVVALLKAQQIRHIRLYDADRVTETGWPSKGDSNEPDATMENANTYNSNLIRHVMNKTGTPKRPGIAVSTYIYELYNEDLKPGPISEKNWGLFDANGDPIYILRLTDSGSLLANDTTNQTYCTAKEGADPKMLQAALDWACGPGKVDCSPLLQGKPCYEPDNVIAHATYAFDTYYHRMGKTSDACDFNGVADITTTDPSHGSCIFPGSLGRNGTMVNITAPSMNSTTSDSPGRSIYGRGGFGSMLLVIKVMVWSLILL